MHESITITDLSTFQNITELIDKMKEYLNPFQTGDNQQSLSIIEREYVCINPVLDYDITYKLGFSWKRGIPVIGGWITVENLEFDIHSVNYYFNELGWLIKEHEGFICVKKEIAISKLLNNNRAISDVLVEIENDGVDIVAAIVLKKENPTNAKF
jgi:hypothetical protein